MKRASLGTLILLCLAPASGCHHPSVTAVSLQTHPECTHRFACFYDPCKEPDGIPFYLPKPLLIVAKNFRNIEEAKVGLTDTAPIPNYFDDQAKYADLNARTNFQGLDANNATGTQAASPDQKFPDKDATNLATKSGQNIFSTGGAPVRPDVVPSDGLKPESFFTYQVVFVPDMTQKYALRVKGGAGEIRAAMNLVNGWQFTGLGPYYMKDSSTAQNTLAGGITANLAASGVADVVKAVAGLRGGAGSTSKLQLGPAPAETTKQADYEQVLGLVDAMKSLHPCFVPIPGYAQITIYEPFISPEGTMEWKMIAEHSYARDVLGTSLDRNEVMNLLEKLPAFRDPQMPPPPAPSALSPLAPSAPANAPSGATAPKILPSTSLPPLPRRSGTSTEQAWRDSRVTSPAAAKSDQSLIRTQATSAPPATGTTLAPASVPAVTAPPIPAVPNLRPGDVLTETTEAPVTALEASMHREVLRGMLAQTGAAGAEVAATSPVIVPPTPVGTNQVNLHQYFGLTKLAGPAVGDAGRHFSLFHHKAKSRPVIKTFDLSGLALSPTSPAPGTVPPAPIQAPSEVKSTGIGNPAPDPASP